MKKRELKKPLPASNAAPSLSEWPVFLEINELLEHFQINQSQDSVMSYDYYLRVLEMARHKTIDQKFNEAIADLNEELETPYVPAVIERYFTDCLRLIRNLVYETKNAAIKNLSRQELITLAIENFPKNMQVFDYLTTKPPGFFNSEDLDYFQFIFTSKDFKNELKYSMLQLLNEIADFHGQKITVKNQNTNTVWTVTLSQEPIISQQTEMFYDEVYTIISNLLGKDPSLEEMGNSVVDQFVFYYFPVTPDCDPLELGKTIVAYIYHALNQTSKLPDSALTNLIQTVLKSQYEK